MFSYLSKLSFYDFVQFEGKIVKNDLKYRNIASLSNKIISNKADKRPIKPDLNKDIRLHKDTHQSKSNAKAQKQKDLHVFNDCGSKTLTRLQKLLKKVRMSSFSICFYSFNAKFQVHAIFYMTMTWHIKYLQITCSNENIFVWDGVCSTVSLHGATLRNKS